MCGSAIKMKMYWTYVRKLGRDHIDTKGGFNNNNALVERHCSLILSILTSKLSQPTHPIFISSAISQLNRLATSVLCFQIRDLATNINNCFPSSLIP